MCFQIDFDCIDFCHRMNRQQAINWTKDDIVYLRIYVHPVLKFNSHPSLDQRHNTNGDSENIKSFNHHNIDWVYIHGVLFVKDSTGLFNRLALNKRWIIIQIKKMIDGKHYVKGVRNPS